MKVEADAKRIFGLAGIGRSDAAAEAAASLADYAATCKAQMQMRQEQSADSYNLGALHVDFDSRTPE